MRTRYAWRKFVNSTMLAVTGLCALITVSALFFILGYLVYNGFRALDWDFFTKLPAPPGQTGGGMANAIIGSAKLILLAIVIGVPVGFMAGVYLAEYSGRTFGFLVRYTTDLLNGIPSIVIGIFAYAVAVLPVKRFSTLAGGIALSLILIPIVVRSTEQFLRAVPNTLREGALALGARDWQALAFVIAPAAARGIATGAILGVARIAGETAPLLFTSFNNRYWSHGWMEPASSLPVMIFTYAIAPYEDWHRQAWAAGLVLLALVLLTNIATRLILSKGGAER
jgi:phosphate transport system permease protein